MPKVAAELAPSSVPCWPSYRTLGLFQKYCWVCYVPEAACSFPEAEVPGALLTGVAL